jgi:hypothetical protein
MRTEDIGVKYGRRKERTLKKYHNVRGKSKSKGTYQKRNIYFKHPKKKKKKKKM